MKIRLLEPAIEDLRDGTRFYEAQSPGLGYYFLDSLLSDIDSLMIYGGIHRVIQGYHRALSKRFPYAIYYKIEGEIIVVRSVLDCRRNPHWISRRIRES